MDAAEPIVLAPYDKAWPHWFAAESKRILAALTPYGLHAVEHVGSTAIAGMIAKPVIDIMAGVDDFKRLPARSDVFWKKLGYEWGHGDDDEPDWLFFIKRDGQRRRRIHLHIVPLGGAFWVRTLAFRDALRRDPSLSGEYRNLKIRLAEQFRFDRKAYLAGKTRFVRDAEVKYGGMRLRTR